MLRGERQRQDHAEEPGEQRQPDEHGERGRAAADRGAEVTERAHPEVSKPPGADSSKSGLEAFLGAATGLGRGLGAGDEKRAGWTALAGCRVAAGGFTAGDAGALVGVRGAIDTGLGAGLGVAALIAARGAVAVAVAAAGTRSAGRTRSAGAVRRPRRVGAACCAEAGGDGAGLSTPAATAKPSHRLNTAAAMETASLRVVSGALTASGTGGLGPSGHQAQVAPLRSGARADDEAGVLADAPRAGDAHLQDGAGGQEALEGAQPRGSARHRERAHGAARPTQRAAMCAERGALTDSSVTRTPPRLK